MAKISPMLDFNGNRVYFFYFVTWISLIFWTFLVVFTTILARKSWKPKWYSWSAKKKNWNHLVIRLGSRAGAEREARSGGRSGGPRAQPSHQVVSIYFYFALHETTLVSRFLAKILVKPPRRLKKIHETRSQKKRHGFYLKLCGILWKFLKLTFEISMRLIEISEIVKVEKPS